MAVFLVRLDAEALGGVLEGFGRRAFHGLQRPDLHHGVGLMLGGDVAELERDALGILRKGHCGPPTGLDLSDVLVAKLETLCVKHYGDQSFKIFVVTPVRRC